MKKTVIYFLILCIQWLFAGEVDVLLDSALLAYKNKKFDVAINKYKRVLELGYISSELYYNLGNAYYRAKDFPRALWSYEKALCWDPSFRDATYNVELLNRLVFENKIRPPYISTVFFWKIYGLMPWRSWAVISLILFTLAVMFYLLFLFSKTILQRKWFFYLLLIALGLWFFTLMITIVGYRQIFHNPYAYVVDNTVVVRNEAMDDAPSLGTIKPGTKIRIFKTVDGYYQIETSEGVKGWIKKGNILPLKSTLPLAQ